MKKTLLSLCMLLGSLVAFAQTIPVDQYGNVLLTDYQNFEDNQSVTITISIDETSVTGSGWGIGTIKPINNSSADPAYSFNSKTAGAEGGAINLFEFTIAELKDFAKVDGAYFVDEYQQSGITINLYNGASLVSIEVGGAVEASDVLDFENNTLGDTYIASEGVATVVENPSPKAGNTQSLSYEVTNYDQIITLGTIILPEGTTLAEYEKITFDVYTASAQYKELLVKIGESPLWGNGIYKKVSAGNAWATLSINLTTGVTTDADGAEFAKGGEKGGTAVYTDGTLNSFELALGINDGGGLAYYLDNIKFVKGTGAAIPAIIVPQTSVYPVAGGIAVATSEKVSIYSIDGRLVKTTVGAPFIPLAHGLYIVKIANEKAQKVVIK
jgi:hypothetical protein